MGLMISSILTHFDAATTAQLSDGIVWYDRAHNIAREMSEATDLTVEQCAAIIAHLSPRTKWADNVHRAWLVATTGTCPGLTRNRDKAIAVREGDNIASTFGKAAHKTRAFYANIAGDAHSVTVDVWAARAAGLSDDVNLSSAVTYAEIVGAYQHAAAMRGVDPAVMQATTWCVIRKASF